VKVKDLIAAIPENRFQYVVGEVVPELGLYFVSIPQASGGENSKVLAYNYNTDAWAIFTHPLNESPAFLTQHFASGERRELRASLYDGHLYRYNDEETVGGLTDFGTNIPCRILFKKHTFNNMGRRSAVRRVYLQATTVPGTATLKVFRDDKTVPSSSKSISLYKPVNDATDWKAFNTSTLGDPGSTQQVEFTYSGKERLDLAGYGIEAELLQRPATRAS